MQKYFLPGHQCQRLRRRVSSRSHNPLTTRMVGRGPCKNAQFDDALGCHSNYGTLVVGIRLAEGMEQEFLSWVIRR